MMTDDQHVARPKNENIQLKSVSGFTFPLTGEGMYRKARALSRRGIPPRSQVHLQALQLLLGWRARPHLFTTLHPSIAH